MCGIIGFRYPQRLWLSAIRIFRKYSDASAFSMHWGVFGRKSNSAERSVLYIFCRYHLILFIRLFDYFGAILKVSLPVANSKNREFTKWQIVCFLLIIMYFLLMLKKVKVQRFLFGNIIRALLRNWKIFTVQILSLNIYLTTHVTLWYNLTTYIYKQHYIIFKCI